MLFAGALLFWAVTLTTLTLVELSGFVAPDEKEKLRLVGGSFALSFFYSAVREAFTTREKPIMFTFSNLGSSPLSPESKEGQGGDLLHTR